ncbi:MAG TPA: pyruvate, phosphate dikinase [Bacilli bacterium]
MNARRVVHFHEGNARMKQLLGGKGANLAEMTNAGLPVPPGFTVTTDACREYFAAHETMPPRLFAEITEALSALEQARGETFGGANNPLLVSVRSGSVTSMPGMMDTILNLGLNDVTVAGLSAKTQNPRFAYDCYRRLMQMFGNVVFGIDSQIFEQHVAKLKQTHGFAADREVTADAWKSLIATYKSIFRKQAQTEFPQDVLKQLHLAVEAVFRSWNNPRAIVYRKAQRIPDDQGTAVNIQAMVFGNLGEDSGTGVLFTRNPATGANTLFGEYLTNAQGEDVVSGARTPLQINQLAHDMPDVYRQLAETARRLELHYRDMQDIEFTVEQGKLYLLQTRSGKRTAQAAVKIAVDMASDGIIQKHEALQRIEAEHLDRLLHPAIDPQAQLDVIANGLPASPGAATGQIVFSADTAEAWAKQGKKTILASVETTPEDIHGVIAAEGVLTARGGMTSHAAVVARGMGKPCVCGCEDLRIDEEQKSAMIGKVAVSEGDWITIDGASGRIIRGAVNLQPPELSADLAKLLAWADEVRRLRVYANADNPVDAERARSYGAEGIGLCRTEHMFMSPRRVPVVQEMFLAETEQERKAALNKLLPMQQADFVGIFTAMSGLPVTIRLLDPPLHEFLPNLPELLLRRQRLELENRQSAEIAQLDNMIRKVRNLVEANPMLGHRGCRLGIIFPEIYDMQVEAIFNAALICLDQGIEVAPEIMIPLVGHANELAMLRKLVETTAEQVLRNRKHECRFRVGTMIEVPRAALTADKIAAHADFFSFGTNDLTQMTFGYSRDDAEGKFLPQYVERNILAENPFRVLDHEGVGLLVKWAVQKGRETKPGLRTGICGEHGGEKESIAFCHRAGLDYVSCSPFRVPFAKIAAAQAALAEQQSALAKKAKQLA